MNDTIITVEHLSKRYRLGQRRHGAEGMVHGNSAEGRAHDVELGAG